MEAAHYGAYECAGAKMIRAVVFDCFGVLASDGWLPFKKEYFGANQELFDRATELNKLVDSRLADYDDFICEVALMAGVDESVARERIESNVPDAELFAYIAEKIKGKYALGMLSNAGANWLDEIFEPAQVALFDAVALSYEMGVVKPDPRAYQTIAERLGVEPNECVLIDDQERYCAGAQSVGMQAILYRNVDELRGDLNKLLAANSDDQSLLGAA